jgi:hypothetical protein
VKYFLAILVVVIGLLMPVNGFAWSEEPSPTDDASYYEMAYTQCAFRLAGSASSERSVVCLCSLTAEHALKWRERVSDDKIPPLPDQDQARCADSE